jgi:hypothetical protein
MKIEKLVKEFKTHQCALDFEYKYIQENSPLLYSLYNNNIYYDYLLSLLPSSEHDTGNNEVRSSTLLLSPFAFLRQRQILHTYIIPEGGHGTEKNC